MNYYALTIRRNGLSKNEKQATQCLKDLKFFIQRLKTTRTDIDIRVHYECVEHPNGYNIHLHAMLSSSNKVKKADIKTCKGYHVDFSSIRSRIAWNCYITKDNDTPEAIILRVRQTAGVGPPKGYAEDNPDLTRETYLDPEYLEYGITSDRFKNKLPGI